VQGIQDWVATQDYRWKPERVASSVDLDDTLEEANPSH
jgi:hypothetical protein